MNRLAVLVGLFVITFITFTPSQAQTRPGRVEKQLDSTLYAAQVSIAGKQYLYPGTRQILAFVRTESDDPIIFATLGSVNNIGMATVECKSVTYKPRKAKGIACRIIGQNVEDDFSLKLTLFQRGAKMYEEAIFYSAAW